MQNAILCHWGGRRKKISGSVMKQVILDLVACFNFRLLLMKPPRWMTHSGDTGILTLPCAKLQNNVVDILIRSSFNILKILHGELIIKSVIGGTTSYICLMQSFRSVNPGLNRYNCTCKEPAALAKGINQILQIKLCYPCLNVNKQIASTWKWQWIDRWVSVQYRNDFDFSQGKM